MKIDPKIQARFTRPLIRWYRGAGRDLPWRNAATPYAVWVSEVMLQQTQVATVLPYYHRFLSAFPTLLDLADAPLEKVLKLWQGLGYYARARHLHRAAQEIVARYGGEMPGSFDTLHALPGIGRSTAGAILTIAFGQRHPILDGNVRRVLCRFFAIEKDPREKKTEARLWSISTALLPLKDPGFFLQAIMDLGATLCKPKSPQCLICPIKAGCEGLKKGLQESLPMKTSRKTVPHFDVLAGVLLYRDQVLVRRRPLKGLLAGLWEFPERRLDVDATDLPSGAALQAFFKKELNGVCATWLSWMTLQHAFTHFRMSLHVYKSRTPKKGRMTAPYQWVRRDRLAELPFSASHQKIVLKLTQ